MATFRETAALIRSLPIFCILQRFPSKESSYFGKRGSLQTASRQSGLLEKERLAGGSSWWKASILGAGPLSFALRSLFAIES
jgi:hypothetical protein